MYLYWSYISIIIFYDALSIYTLSEGGCWIQYIHDVDGECYSDVSWWISTILQQQNMPHNFDRVHHESNYSIQVEKVPIT